ncbi:ATP-binding cassette sub-family A member 3-like 2 [Homarus americanus]|uniref:ATP-binding cassette sub-family A member 3-like 2 n=1 Tax=Homarus americanus TaxID=6706 RepID=A0A8J5JPA9_HOMAM|nr:ATP-binding cassette sub-family A member 3-like 2 [Homarus americanus]
MNLDAILEDGLGNSSSSSQQQLFSKGNNGLERMTGNRLLMQRIKAFFIKRIIYSKRKWPLIITQTFDFLISQEPQLVLNTSLFPYSSSFMKVDPDLESLSFQYRSLFSGSHEVSSTDNMTGSLLKAAHDNLLHYRENNICSAEFLSEEEANTLRILTQTIPFHTLGIGTSLVTNALLRLATNSTIHTITTTNWPLPPDTTWLFSSEFSTSSLVYANMMPLALAFLSASFLVFPLQERETNTKQVQVMTGAPVWALWATTFLWDFTTYMISLLLIYICFMTMDPNGYFTKGEAPGALFLLLLLYGWGSIPMAYVFSFPFQTAASGFAVLALVNIVAGQLMTVVVWGLRMAEQPTLTTVSDILYWATSVIPAYPVATGFGHIVQVGVHNSKCNQFNETVTQELCKALYAFAQDNDFMQCCRYGDPPLCSKVGTGVCLEEWSYYRLQQPGMGSDLLSLFVNGIIFFGIIVFIEAGAPIFFIRLWRRISYQDRKFQQVKPQGQVREVDEDVVAEADLVTSLMTGSQPTANTLPMINGSVDATLLASMLSKQYYGCLVRAVDNISFRVNRGECLGLLGVNGAGKTTTFKMLTGDEVPTAGDATIDGLSLSHERNKFVQNIGYCPQFDAFLDDLTGVEMLHLMGRLRGMSEAQLRENVNSLVSLVGLTECAKRPSSTYSGGNRRKLSTALALVGNPPLVFLDEPTSGVDPVSRRRVWTAIRQAINNGQSVVLTSHSMEECEALCSRIIIMSRGRLRCVGTTGHLKAKFGQGYSLQVKLRTHGFTQGNKSEDEQIYVTKVNELKIVINYFLPGSTLTDQHKGMLAYRVPISVSWGQLFSVMEALKAGRDPGAATPLREDLPLASPSTSIVEVYAASDTSLEQVFLSFAREAAMEQAPGVPGTVTDNSVAPVASSASIIQVPGTNNSLDMYEVPTGNQGPLAQGESSQSKNQDGSPKITEL